VLAVDFYEEAIERLAGKEDVELWYNLGLMRKVCRRVFVWQFSFFFLLSIAGCHLSCMSLFLIVL
jgi:hypothetical protein